VTDGTGERSSDSSFIVELLGAVDGSFGVGLSSPKSIFVAVGRVRLGR
jgi:hypothetical protein